MALVAAIDIGLLELPDVGIGSWCQQPSGLLATAVQRRHGCGTGERLAALLRELLG